MLYLLIIIICINLYISYKHVKVIVAPPVLFSLGFLLCSLNAMNYYNEWGLSDFHFNTFCTISIGVSLFTFTSLCVSKKKYHRMTAGTNDMINIYIPTKFLFVFSLYFLIVLILVFRSLQHATGYSDFASVAYTVDSTNKFDDTDTIALPFWVNLPFKIAYTFACLLSYMGIKAFLSDKRNMMNLLMYFIIFCMLILSPLLFGGRAGSVKFLWLIAFMIFFIYSERKNWKYRLPIKMVIITISSAYILVYSWTSLASLLGRYTEDQNDEYRNYIFAMYCGAQIKNLDLLLNEYSNTNKKYIGYATFSQLYNKFIPKNEREKIHQFRYHKGYGLGNVYTCFYSYVYDFGYLGLILVTLYSFALTKLWYRVRYINGKYKVLLLCTYGILSYSIFMSFFSESIISNVFSTSFIVQIFLWFVEFKFIEKLFSRRNCHNREFIVKRV